ncbi:MFS transporter [Acidianus brierleyi]|uniref:MFS transporter n=1 Tax=Acidianus brierleyi TaxID=41673 RepID=A0A2U9IC66_9CREN|nr:MFS transporter [Acidianus brierleyi]AWR93584.1 MFS transporter [Acidianus brierleyi]
MKKITIAGSMIGTIIEWYDIFIFSSGSVYIGEELFPSSNKAVAVLDVLLVFALGFLTRPIGAFLFGHYGDRNGRKYSLLITLLISGISSGLVGVLPTYAQLGLITIILLVILRLVLGLGLGGEWGGAILLVNETNERKRAFFSAFVQSTVGIGLLLGTGVFLILTSYLPSSEMFSFGWRIPFLLSFIMVAVGITIRLKIDETRLFTEVKNSGLIVRFPGKEMVVRYWKELLLGTLLAGSLGTIFYVGAVLLPVVFSGLGIISENISLIAVSLLAIADLTTVFISGKISDIIGRRLLLLLSNLGSLAIIIPAFEFRNPASFIFFVTLFGIFHGLGYSPLAASLSEMFPTIVRYSGSSSAYQFGNSFIAGPASYISDFLGSISYALYPLYSIAFILIAIYSTIRMKETKDLQLNE